jgi:hypothetical protein
MSAENLRFHRYTRETCTPVRTRWSLGDSNP